MAATLGLLLLGLLLLMGGGELLVRGAVRTAERLGVSPLLIGLTLVGFGTSTPELVTSVEAARAGSPGIAIGNIVGSNIANILLVLGLSAAITPLSVSARALRRDGALMVGTALLFSAAGLSLGYGRSVGAVLAAGLILYLALAYHEERRPQQVARAGHTAAFDKGEAVELVDRGLHGPLRRDVVGILGPLLVALGGLALVVLGGRTLVRAAVDLARLVGLSEAAIGLTVVAVGTSLPEFVTSLVAAIRRQTDIAVGNVLGSNIYNVMGIGGITALVAPTILPPEMGWADLGTMVSASILLFLFAINGRVSRGEGLALLAGYVGYTAFLLGRG
ncbi:MAG: calcium/sodium antiporter [Sphingomonadaceae bacterium]|uniref:calcium/sodium antiporter n=1 Tax=Thermaurantiacus sp. TaxID=2820283 RepID=UPI00298F2F54|nr:calcium/sodium antiporter [Thermaurantiacus sp.]MCS6985831.1 calcium/sodium antiporter [Sphingomonadaceae bacterium]MDW8413900.1 calcium/sodium antiporter [Thermaurantiacus sp.]